MATAKLVGRDDVALSGNGGADYISTTKFIALATGNVTEIKIRASGSGNVKVAIYADSSNTPGSRLGVVNTSTAVVAGVNTITFPSTPITKDTYYWLAFLQDAAVCGYKLETALNKGWKATPFANGLPDPAGTGFTYATDSNDVIAGWGILTLSPTGISQAVALGAPTVVLGTITISPTGIAQGIALGTPALIYPQILSPTGIAQGIALGTLKLNFILYPSGIAQPISFGPAYVRQNTLFETHQIGDVPYNCFGTHWRGQTFTVANDETHILRQVRIKFDRQGNPGTGTISIKATDGAGKPTGADLCSQTINGNNFPADPDEAWQSVTFDTGTVVYAGTKYALIWRFPDGDTTPNLARSRHKYPGTYSGGTAVTSEDSGATWTVVTDWDFVFEEWGGEYVPPPQTINPSGIAQAIALGTPMVFFPGLILPQGIEQLILVGTPAVWHGIPPQTQTIIPVGIAQVIAFGNLTILKHVYHVILDGQYATESPDINRAYVIGRDSSGNPVYGTAVDSTEVGLVGERLDAIQELAIPSSSLAASVASAILAKMRLTGKRGVILIPPNCGQELWDAVQITDAGANQSAVKFRVVGIRFEYNPKQARYQHRLILGAP
jgi:hypothetical protein